MVRPRDLCRALPGVGLQVAQFDPVITGTGDHERQ